jgi:DNA-binding MarR family transcriptional regulator
LIRDEYDMATELSNTSNYTDAAALAQVGTAPAQADHFVPIAREMFSTRSLVRRHAEQAAIVDGCWDILLSLYLHGEVTISNLRKVVGLPLTTTLRWLDLLDDQGLVTRREKPNDRRAVLVDINDKGRLAVERLLSRLGSQDELTSPAGLPAAAASVWMYLPGPAQIS